MSDDFYLLVPRGKRTSLSFRDHLLLPFSPFAAATWGVIVGVVVAAGLVSAYLSASSSMSVATLRDHIVAHVMKTLEGDRCVDEQDPEADHAAHRVASAGFSFFMLVARRVPRSRRRFREMRRL